MFITFLYNVVITWVSTVEISRSVRAQKEKNSLLRAVHRQNRRTPKGGSLKKTFHFFGKWTQRAFYRKVAM
jgi:hypothetical protein